MGFLKNLRASGDFVDAWQARFGSLSRWQLDWLRDRTLGLFTAWTQVSDQYPGTVEDFIDSFAGWAFPSPEALEYLVAFRTVVAGLAAEDEAQCPALAQWLAGEGPTAWLFPPYLWIKEWSEGVEAGRFERGRKDGRLAEANEVILGATALKLVSDQCARSQVDYMPPSVTAAEVNAPPTEFSATFRETMAKNFAGDPRTIKSQLLLRQIAFRKVKGGPILMEYPVEEIESLSTGATGAVTAVYREADPVDESQPFVAFMHSPEFPMGATQVFATEEDARTFVRKLREATS